MTPNQAIANRKSHQAGDRQNHIHSKTIKRTAVRRLVPTNRDGDDWCVVLLSVGNPLGGDFRSMIKED